jgi:hypothetical protein
LVKRLLVPSLLLLGLCLSGAAIAAADPPPFTITPGGPIRAGVPYTFTAADGNPADSWDLDGDGVPDKTGSEVTWAYRQPGPVVVTLNGKDGLTAQLQIQVLGAPADFSVYPPNPVVGQPVQFVYTAREATSSIDWDLNADGVFGDVKGAVATETFTSPGTYDISLQVTDIEDPPARTSSTQLIRVLPAGPTTTQGRQLRLMSPFPIVRITGKVLRAGALIKSLTVQTPYGATVRVRCHGRGCPFRRTSRTLAIVGKAKLPSRTLRVRKLYGRRLGAGASIKVLVSRPGEVGKYTHFVIRRRRPPRRTDACLLPGSTKPVECPSS